VRNSEEAIAAQKQDPWELVGDAISRMQRNGDVMRSDRLKQVMQEIDSSFDEKNLGMSKFSRFCQEAAQRGLLTITKLENGQLEIDLPGTITPTPAQPQAAQAPAAPKAETESEGEERGSRRGRRGRGGRGRGREREPREGAEAREAPKPTETPVSSEAVVAERETPAVSQPRVAREEPAAEEVGTGERLTRTEAFDLLRRTVEALAKGDESVRASDVRSRARQLLGRDSESLSDRMFVRILKDAHDEGIIDLRRRGNDFEVARAADAVPVADQVAKNDQAAAAAHAAKQPVVVSAS
jgi:OST-HTH/LOTUS domain